MRDDKLGCATMHCPKHGIGHIKSYWCCHGCDEEDCNSRCYNDRSRCGCATDSASFQKVQDSAKMSAYKLWQRGKMNKLQAAKAYGVPFSTFCRFIEKQEEMR